ncbi:MAG TPA: hypothetical protein VGC89_15470 [Pyrinomonadaceae bacterium]
MRLRSALEEHKIRAVIAAINSSSLPPIAIKATGRGPWSLRRTALAGFTLKIQRLRVPALPEKF